MRSTFGSDGHIFEADGFRISLGESVWRMCQDDPHFAAALHVVVRDTRGGELGGEAVIAVAVAKLANMSKAELQRVTMLEDVLVKPNW